MPYKDLEVQKAKVRDLMRQRRARAKQINSPLSNTSEAAALPSVPAPAIPAQPDNLILKSPVDVKEKPVTKKVVPAPIAPSAGAKPYQKTFLNPPEFSYWSRFPGQTGRDCFNDPTLTCCYDLNFPVPWVRTYCPPIENVPICEYAKKKEG
jgi:hypothetical protein